MNKSNVDFLMNNVKPGDILYITEQSWIADVIAFGQGEIDKTWTRKLGHAVYVSDDMNVIESSITIEGLKYVSGIHITPLKNWVDLANDGNPEECLFIQRLNGITGEQITIASNNGRGLQAQGVKYPIGELVGTLISYANHNWYETGIAKFFLGKDKAQKYADKALTNKNPLDNSNNRYCIATVNFCYEHIAGLRMIPSDINESVCAVGDGLKNKDRDYTLMTQDKPDPTKFITYVKPAGVDFDSTLGQGYAG